jgi:hypothetical protein
VKERKKMAYGKQPLANANVGSWRRQANANEVKKENMRSSRKAWAGSRFADVYWPQETPDLIRLIPGQYKVQSAIEIEKGKYGVQTDTLVYYTCGQHFDGITRRSFLCSGGPMFMSREHAEPCIPCKSYFSAPRKDGGGRDCRFGFRNDLYIFTVLDYLPYVKIEQTDNHGLVKLSAKTGKAYTKWVRKGTVDAAILEEKQGHIMHWPIYYRDFTELMDADSIINSSCAHCGSAKSITRLALICQKCGEAIIDCRQTSVLVKDQDTMLDTPVVCPYCKHKAPSVEYLDCSRCEAPVRATIFDVDLTVSKRREKGSVVRIHEVSSPHTIDALYKAQPLNLPGIYVPDSIETQESLFGVSWTDLNSPNNTD